MCRKDNRVKRETLETRQLSKSLWQMSNILPKKCEIGHSMSYVSEALLCMDEVPALCGKLSVPIRLFISDSSQLSLVLESVNYRQPMQTGNL